MSSRAAATAVLAAAVLAGLALRLWGITFGLPGKYRPDEEYLVGTSLGFLQPGTDYNPHFFIYPSLFFYILAAALASCKHLVETFGLFGRTDFMSFLAAHGWAPGHLIGRATSALFGGLGILAIFPLTRRFAGTAGGLIASIFLAVNYVHARESHFATTDACCFFFSALALTAIITFSERGRFRDSALAGVLVGLAVSAKYPALCLMAPFAFAHVNRLLVRPGLRELARVIALGLVGLLAVAAGFGLTSPYVILDFETVKKNFEYQQGWVTGGLPGLVMDLGWRWLVLFALRYGAGIGLCAAALLGALLGIARSVRERRLHPAMLLIVLFAAQAAGLLGSHLLFFRYILLSTLALVPLGAFAVSELCRCPCKARRTAAAVLAYFVIADPLYRTVKTDQLMMAPDTRNAALTWIERHVPPGGAIAVHSRYFYGKPELRDGRRYVDFEALTSSPPAEPSTRWLIVDRYPITMFSTTLSAAQLMFIGERMRSEWQTSPFSAVGETSSIFDLSDAFYIPIDGFSGVARAGPELEIYSLQQ